MTISSVKLAIFGRCSLIRMPDTRVAIGRKGPALAWPVLRSNVSSWDGPPFIHRRMHDFLGRPGAAAAAWASSSNQPETQGPRAPAAESFSQSRRDKRGVDIYRASVGLLVDVNGSE